MVSLYADDTKEQEVRAEVRDASAQAPRHELCELIDGCESLRDSLLAASEAALRREYGAGGASRLARRI